MESIIRAQGPLLDRLAAMNVVYIPGNHDTAVYDWIAMESLPHPFFEQVSRPFTEHIAGRAYHFMHGHEVDPFNQTPMPRLSRVLGLCANAFEFTRGSCIVSQDAIVGAMLEVGEFVKSIYDTLCERLGRVARQCRLSFDDEVINTLRRHMRIHKMLVRHRAHIAEGRYDAVVAGHTHRLGRCGDWYYNTGSWTGRTNDYLTVDSAGQIHLCHWTPAGPERNYTVFQV